MRLRNVKDAKNLIKKSPCFVINPKEHKGSWNEVFENNNPLYIEIGMGKGDFIINMALTYPKVNFIGIEKYASVMLRAVEKVKKTLEDLPNLKLICLDAKELEDVFERDVTTIYLNHSDPWPKARHEKRRLTSSTFLPIYKTISKSDVHIIMKTDNLGLYEYSKESFLDNNYKILNLSEDYNSDTNILTEYEAKFRKLGQPIYYLEILNKR